MGCDQSLCNLLSPMVMRLSYSDRRKEVSAVKVIVVTLTLLQPSVVCTGRRLPQRSLLTHHYTIISLILLYLVTYVSKPAANVCRGMPSSHGRWLGVCSLAPSSTCCTWARSTSCKKGRTSVVAPELNDTKPKINKTEPIFTEFPSHSEDWTKKHIQSRHIFQRCSAIYDFPFTKPGF